jgi:hypothetical protein
MNSSTAKILVFLMLFSRTSFAGTITPMDGMLSLVAGEGDPGFRDGEFHSTLFDQPQALAVNAAGTRLYIADRLNHRVRVVDLEDANRVSTLAGGASKGKSDGSLKDATFDSPSQITFVAGDQLVVYDSGNRNFRLLDLTQGRVTTLNPKPFPPGPKLSLEEVYSLAYLPQDKALYFSQPTLNVLRRLDLSTLRCTTYKTENTLPHPGALAAYQGKLCAADLYSPSIYRLDWGPKEGDEARVEHEEIGKGTEVVALAAAGEKLYALQRGKKNYPWAQIAPHPGPVSFFSPWGNPLEAGSMEMTTLFDLRSLINSSLGFTVDPLDPGHFYLCLPYLNSVIALRDRDWDQNKDAEAENGEGLTDFKYPPQKPKKTFRILVVGDSRVFFGSEAERGKRWPWGTNRFETSSKRLEQYLNALSSLNGNDLHYEVINSSAKYATPVFLRASVVSPGLIEKYDIDLLLVCVPVDFSFNFYFEHPYNELGLPQLKDDGEFLLKPLAERIQLDKDPALADLYRRCVSHHWATAGKLDFQPFPTLIEDSGIREDLFQLIGKPLKPLVEQVSGMKTQAGKPVAMGVVFFPTGNLSGGDQLPIEPYRDFYRDISKASGAAFYDMTEAMVATRLSFFPTSELWGFHHFNHNGQDYFAWLMARELLQDQLIPMEMKGKKP